FYRELPSISGPGLFSSIFSGLVPACSEVGLYSRLAHRGREIRHICIGHWPIQGLGCNGVTIWRNSINFISAIRHTKRADRGLAHPTWIARAVGRRIGKDM